MVRVPAVAGQFYPAEKEALSVELDSLIPDVVNKIDPIGAICPHAGYMFSGRVAGEVYARMHPAETYIVLSPNHTGYGARYAVSDEDWETPLGVVAFDAELAGSIISSTDLLAIDPDAHLREHSVEVQLPFIRKISPEAKIVPITFQSGEMKDLREIALSLSASIKDSGRNVVIISSSDMTHYESRVSASAKDALALMKIGQLDPEGLLRVVHENNISMCGCVPSAIMLFAARELGAEKAELIKYADSGDALDDTSQVVGYAGVIVS